MSEQNRLEINWANALGGALAAVSAAVLLSTLGTAGTLIGAALGSLCITIGGAIYSHSMRVAHERLLARRAMLARISADRGRGASRTRRLDVGEDEPETRESRLQMLRTLPWRRIVAVSAGVFVIAMAVIVAFELTTGRPVSYYTGGTGDTDKGTSVPGIGGDGGGTEPGGPAQGEDDPPTGEDEDPAEDEQDPLQPPEEDVPPAEETPEPAPTEVPAEPQTAAP